MSPVASPVTLVTLLTAGAYCPFCASERARQVRAALFDGELATNALGVALPFLVLIVGVVVMSVPRRRPR